MDLRTFEQLADDTIYPGHPAFVAYLITLRYKNLEEAYNGNGQAPGAQFDPEIPGSGVCVKYALRILQRLYDGTPFAEAVNGVSKEWEALEGKNPAWAKNREQAIKIQARFRDAKNWWESGQGKKIERPKSRAV